MSEEDDRFGISPELMRQVIEEHRGIIRVGCYVPTRHEVATAEPALLESALIDWWWESPTALIATRRQVNDVLAILKARPDAASEGIQRILKQAPTDADFG
jgi:hypothetical protein